MRTFTRVYVWTVEMKRRRTDGGYEQETFTHITYTKEEALAAMFDAVRVQMRYYGADHITTPTRSDMLKYLVGSEDKNEYLNLYVDEYSVNRKQFVEPEGLLQEYQKVIARGDDQLYDELLALVSYNREYYNGFCEKTRTVTVPQKICGIEAVGSLVESDCKDGKFLGTFVYRRDEKKMMELAKIKELFGKEVEVPALAEPMGKEPKLYFGFSSILCADKDPNVRSSWKPKIESFYSLDEAVKGICERYYEIAKSFVDSDRNVSRDFLDMVAKEKFIRSILAVRVVSGNRIQFDTEKELRNYYVEHVIGVKAEDMYEFLLRFVEYDARYYDAHGEYLNSEASHQRCCRDENRVIPEFSIETAEGIIH